jgi:hypothetical protein
MVRKYLKADGGLSRLGVRKSLVKSRRHVQLALEVGGKWRVESERAWKWRMLSRWEGIVGRVSEVLVDAANQTRFTTSIASSAETRRSSDPIFWFLYSSIIAILFGHRVLSRQPPRSSKWCVHDVTFTPSEPEPSLQLYQGELEKDLKTDPPCHPRACAIQSTSEQHVLRMSRC